MPLLLLDGFLLRYAESADVVRDGDLLQLVAAPPVGGQVRHWLG